MCENNETGKQDKVNILIVDDHPIVSYGLKAMLLGADARFDVIGTAGSVAEANDFVDQHDDLDLILLDILLPDGNGIEVLNHIHGIEHKPKVLAISTIDDTDIIVSLVQAGLDGFVNKGCPESVMLEAIRSVMSGLEYFGKPIEQLLDEVELNSQMRSALTNREIEIMRLTAEGYSAKETADKLFVSPRTVESHKSRIFAKLNINTTAELVRYAFRYKLISIN